MVALYTTFGLALLLGVAAAVLYEEDFGFSGFESGYVALLCASAAWSFGALWFVLWLIHIACPTL